MGILFFSAVMAFSCLDIFMLAKAKKKREMAVYIIIAVLSVIAGAVYLYSDIRLTGALHLEGG